MRRYSQIIENIYKVNLRGMLLARLFDFYEKLQLLMNNEAVDDSN